MDVISDFHLPMDYLDLQELVVQRAHVASLITGFYKSQVCKSLSEEFNVPVAPFVVPTPSSPSIEELPSTVIRPSEDTPLLASEPGSVPSPIAMETDPPVESKNYIFQLLDGLFPSSSASREVSYRPSFWTQFAILSRRTFTNFYRNPMLMWAHYGLSIVLACMFFGGRLV